MLLKLGSSGPDVTKLQQALGLITDGSFGPGTEKAVKDFQSKNGLGADGIVGDSTWSKIISNTSPIQDAGSLKLSKLQGHVPDSVIAQIPDTASKFNITTPLRLAHFLAQCGHESGGFSVTTENLNYSAEGLVRIFGKYFNATTAPSYARNPEKIANKVYSSRMGNGNEASGDGWKFKGRGYIQLTGKDNYSNFDKTVNDDILSNPDLIATKYPLASAAYFFDSNNLWTICDKGSDEATVTSVTKRVNGGTIGLADRLKHFIEFYNLLK